MDSLTQAALGAVIGERFLGSRLGRSALAWGALVGTLPDLDILAYPFLDPIAELYWHRGFSHSIAGVIVGTPIIAWLLSCLWNREKVPLENRVSFKRATWFAFLNFTLHILIDCFTSYGTQLLEPFSNRRFGLDNFFIIDPLFTLPMLIWIAVALTKHPKPGVVSRKWTIGCSSAIVGYTLFSFIAQGIAKQRFETELATHGIEPARGQVTAAPFNTLIWRGLFETETAYWIGYWAVTDSPEPLSFTRVERRIDLLEPYRDDRAIQCVRWFSEDYLLVEPGSQPNSFRVTDIRFTEFWPDDTNRKPRTFFSWEVASAAGDQPAIFESIRSSNRDVSGLFRKMRDRLSGHQEAMLPHPTIPGRPRGLTPTPD